MPINSPDSFQSLGTAIVNGGETTQITEVYGADGIEVSNFKSPILSQNFIPEATAAYSLRQLRSGASYCIQVQRGGVTPKDIGFALNEKGIMAIDMAELQAYANEGVGEIRVQIIYDQSGNDNHLTSGTGGARFKALDGNNEPFLDSQGNPYLDGTGSDDFYNTASAISINEDFSWLVVSAGGFSPATRYFGSPTADQMSFTFQSTNQVDMNNAPTTSSAVFDGNTTRSDEHIFWFNSANVGDELYGYQDNVASTSNPISQTAYSYPRTIDAGTGTNVDPSLGSIYYVGGGNWQECIVWADANNAANKDLIYNHTNYYYRTQASVTDESMVIKQPDLVRPKSTALSMTGVGTGAGSTGIHSIVYYDWQADGASIDYEAGEIVYWRTDFNKWARAGAGSYETTDSGTLLLGMATSSSSGAKVVRRGFVRCDVGFAGVPIGTPCYLWFQGTVTTSKPTFHNYSQRLVGWTVDQDASAGLMFFSPDVNYTIRA